jgi:hypothetical protein
MWDMKYFVILVIIRATRIVTVGLIKYLGIIPEKQAADSVLKAEVLGTQ